MRHDENLLTRRRDGKVLAISFASLFLWFFMIGGGFIVAVLTFPLFIIGLGGIMREGFGYGLQEESRIMTHQLPGDIEKTNKFYEDLEESKLLWLQHAAAQARKNYNYLTKITDRPLNKNEKLALRVADWWKYNYPEYFNREPRDYLPPNIHEFIKPHWE